jgi:type V secretory pathway adhesin AidA
MGNDELFWVNSSNSAANGVHVNDLLGWEAISLTEGSELRFNTGSDDMILGDAATGTGSLFIDASSSVDFGNGSAHEIRPAVSGERVSVVNAGTIDLSSDATVEDGLTIIGNYFGDSGRVLLDTFLAGDGSPSDLLVIDGGTATGITALDITNIGGLGAETTGSGILVVDAINGATTDNAFVLAGPVVAGRTSTR